MDKGEFLLKDLITYFDTYNRSEGKSPATLRWYNQALNTLLAWLAETHRGLSIGSIDENTIREFIIWSQERTIRGHKVAVYSVNSRVRALRAFFNWLFHQEYTVTHLLQGLRPPRLPKMMVDTLSDEEIGMIMSSQDRSTLAGSRNLAILALFLDAGLRLSELSGLKTGNVHIEEQYVKVMGKGSKERMVAFGATARNALIRYAVHLRGELARPGVEEFFLTIDGNSLSPEAIKSMLRRVGQAAGVPRLHAHLCRHTYATNFLINGGNVLLLKQNLGHTTLAMVDRYVHLATSKAAMLSRDYSPLDRLNIKSLRRGSPVDYGKRPDGVKVFSHGV